MKRLLLAVAIAIVLFAPLKAKAMPAPNLSQNSLDSMRLIVGQAESLALAQEGIRVPRMGDGGIQLLFRGLYELQEAFASWIGKSDGYEVKDSYLIDRYDWPDWLREQFSDEDEFYMYDVDYYGVALTLIVDEQGNIVIKEADGKQELAVNVRIKNEAYEAAQEYAKGLPQDRKHIPYVHASTEVSNIANAPYISGTRLYFTIVHNGTPTLVYYPDFTNCALLARMHNGFLSIGVVDTKYSSLATMPYFKNASTDEIIVSGGLGNDNVRFTFNNTEYTGYYRYWIVQSLISTNSVNSFNIPYTYTSITDLNYRSIGAIDTVNSLAVQNNQRVSGTASCIFMGTVNGQEVEGLAEKVPQSTEMSADSLDSITQAIEDIMPQIDAETGIEIIEIPDAFPEAETVPLEPETEPLPDDPIGPGIEDFPESDPEQVPEYDPEIDPAIEATEDELPDSESAIPLQENLSIVTGLQNRFPFSIPWDIYNALSMLQAERETPHWEWLMQINIPGGETFEYNFVLDLGFMSSVAKLFRDLFLLSFILGLAVYSYNKFFGGGA